MISASLADEPARWRAAGRALVAKMLAELAFEEVLTPHRATARGTGR